MAYTHRVTIMSSRNAGVALRRVPVGNSAPVGGYLRCAWKDDSFGARNLGMRRLVGIYGNVFEVSV